VCRIPTDRHPSPSKRSCRVGIARLAGSFGTPPRETWQLGLERDRLSKAREMHASRRDHRMPPPGRPRPVYPILKSFATASVVWLSGFVGGPLNVRRKRGNAGSTAASCRDRRRVPEGGVRAQKVGFGCGPVAAGTGLFAMRWRSYRHRS